LVKVRLTVEKEPGVYVSKNLEVEPYAYMMATGGKWEMVISDDEVNFNRGEVKKVKVKRIVIPNDCLILPSPYQRHAFLVVISVIDYGGPRPVEKTRYVDQAVCLAIDKGEVKKGDLLGIINVFPIALTRYAKEPREIRISYA